MSEETKKGMFRITSDGSAKGTKVYGPDGADLSEQVNSVSFHTGPGGAPKVTLELKEAQVEAEVPAGKVEKTGKAMSLADAPFARAGSAEARA